MNRMNRQTLTKHSPTTGKYAKGTRLGEAMSTIGHGGVNRMDCLGIVGTSLYEGSTAVIVVCRLRRF